MIKRTIYKQVLKSINEKPVTLITGARQVGKSTLCSLIAKDLGYNYVSLDDINELTSAQEDPTLFLSIHKSPLIIDEVQKCKSLFNVIESIVNKTKFEGNDNRGMFVLTVSESFSLLEDITESMAGRVRIIEMSPLSLREIKNLPEKPFKMDLDECIDRSKEYDLSNDDLYKYIVRGFYPEIYDLDIKNTEQFYKDYVKTYIERDVSQIVNVKNKLKFNTFMQVIASLTGEELVCDNLAKIIGVDVKTIQAWTSVLVTSNIIRLLNVYNENSMIKRTVKRPKVIFCDTGLAAYLSSLNNAEVLKKSIFSGRFVETFIINEIIKSFENTGEHADFYYYRDTEKREIDLVIVCDSKIYRIECKSGMTYSKKDISAFSQLDKTNLELSNSGIVCNTNNVYSIGDNCLVVPISSI